MTKCENNPLILCAVIKWTRNGYSKLNRDETITCQHKFYYTFSSMLPTVSYTLSYVFPARYNGNDIKMPFVASAPKPLRNSLHIADVSLCSAGEVQAFGYTLATHGHQDLFGFSRKSDSRGSPLGRSTYIVVCRKRMSIFDLEGGRWQKSRARFPKMYW